MNVDFVPGTLELCQVVQNVGIVHSSVLEDRPEVLCVLKLSCRLEHSMKSLPHVVHGWAAFGVYHEAFGDVHGDQHLGVIVVVCPVPSTIRITKWVWANDLPIDYVLYLDSSKEIVHQPRPASPVTGFSIQHSFYLCAGRTSWNDDMFNRGASYASYRSRRRRRWSHSPRSIRMRIRCGVPKERVSVGSTGPIRQCRVISAIVGRVSCHRGKR